VEDDPQPAQTPPQDDLAALRALVEDTEKRLHESERRCRELLQQNLYLQEEIKADHNPEAIVGRSPPLLGVLDAVHRVAGTDSTVLITGETGTGKELVARAIHSHSRRKERPLIKVHCPALPPGLLESELFGNVKGTGTGTGTRRVSRLELAHGGTLFLDEIGELPADAQVRLLRVLQERTFERVGGTDSVRVDVRVLAATNRDLPASVRDRSFREELYYRLSVFPLRLPPLRDRKEDIPVLAHFLIGKFTARLGKRIEALSPETMCRLSAYAWPGNVRELSNVLERALILASGPVLEIGADVLPVHTAAAHASHAPPTLEATERHHILSVLGQTNWVIDGPKGAARLLGLHPNTLRSRLKKLGIHRPVS
jgi:transcriptional regulator with GAF, ATPase, and Fis domain